MRKLRALSVINRLSTHSVTFLNIDKSILGKAFNSCLKPLSFDIPLPTTLLHYFFERFLFVNPRSRNLVEDFKKEATGEKTMHIQNLFAIITASAALFPTVSAGEGDYYFTPPPATEKCAYTIYRVASKNGLKALVREGDYMAYKNWDQEIHGVQVHFDGECNPKYKSDVYVFKKGVREEKHIWLSPPPNKSSGVH